MLYPLNIDLTGRRVVVVGGGMVAERKVHGILSADATANILVIAPEATAGLHALAEAGRITWRRECYAYGMLCGAFLVYAATDAREVNAAAAAEAEVIGALVNVIDDAARSDFQVPAFMRRGDLLLTVSTGGDSPALARAIRMELEQFSPPSFGMWSERAAILRAKLQEELPTSSARTEFWRTALRPDILNMIRCGELEKAEVELRHAALDIGAKSSDGSD